MFFEGDLDAMPAPPDKQPCLLLSKQTMVKANTVLGMWSAKTWVLSELKPAGQRACEDLGGGALVGGSRCQAGVVP